MNESVIEILSESSSSEAEEPNVTSYPLNNIRNIFTYIYRFDKYKVNTNIFYLTDLETLKPGNWLNDKIINAYFELLGQTFIETFYFNTFLYTTLREQKTDMKTLQMWYSQINFSKYETFMFPIHRNSHWSLVSITNGRIYGYDSLGTVPNSVYYDIAEFYFHVIQPDLPEHESLKYDNSCLNTPKQNNGDDCGVFCCGFAKYFACSFDRKNFNFDDIPKLRGQILHEILAQKIMYY